jgi:cell division protein FtsZ
MRKHCDTVVVIDDNRLTQLAPQVPARKAFKIADQVLATLIKGVVETIFTPSLMNMDFTDFKTMVSRGGIATVGVGESDSPNRAEEALRNALKTPLLDIDCAAATGALINVTGDNRMTIQEVNRIGEIMTEMLHGNVQVLCGARVNPGQEGKLSVTLVMTGMDSFRSVRDFDKIGPQLFNLDPYAEPEKSLDLELNLYQMEEDL